MRLPGVGYRSAAALSILAVLVASGAATASERKLASVAARVHADPIERAGDATADERELVGLINKERTSRGLKAVVLDPQLSRIARLHGADQRDAGRPSHHSSKGDADYSARLADTSYRASAAAENIACNTTVARAHKMLMGSSGHRRNILDPTMTAVGIGVVPEPATGLLYVVEDFATPITHMSDDEAATKLAAALAVKRGGWWRKKSLPEDRAISRKLDKLLEEMIGTGRVKNVVGTSLGPGWALHFTSMDPSTAPASAMAFAARADAYAVAVSFRKTPRYPLGAYWAILFLKGEFQF